MEPAAGRTVHGGKSSDPRGRWTCGQTHADAAGARTAAAHPRACPKTAAAVDFRSGQHSGVDESAERAAGGLRLGSHNGGEPVGRRTIRLQGAPEEMLEAAGRDVGGAK